MTAGESRATIIGDMLKFLRKELGLKQKDVAERVGIAQQTYAGYESGKHEPSIELAIRLATLYGVTLDFITGRYNDDEQAYDENVWLQTVLPQVKLQLQMEQQYMKAGFEQAKFAAAKDATRLAIQLEDNFPNMRRIQDIHTRAAEPGA